MSSKSIYTPIEIFSKLDKNFEFEVEKNKMLYGSDIESDVFESSLNGFLYLVGSLLENKEVYPKNNKFNFNDFTVNLRDLMLAFKLFYKTKLFDSFFMKSLNQIEGPLQLNIKIGSLRAYYKLKNKVQGVQNNDEFLLELIRVEQFLAKDFRNGKLIHIKNIKSYNSLVIHEFLTEKSIIIFKYINEFEDFLNKYFENLKIKFPYFSMGSIAPVTVLTENERETFILEEHFTKIGLEEKLMERFLNAMKDKNIEKNSKKIISSLPTVEVVYENPIAIYNIISKLSSINVTEFHLEELNKLYDIHPHFHEVIDYLILSLKSNLRNSKILKMKPILLAGTNGIGKTSFLLDLSNIFNLTNNALNYGSVTTPAEISGLTSIWRTGQLGFIGKAINTNNIYNPIIILEELDKVVKGQHNGNLYAPLYDLLENKTAKIFFDNYLGVSLDFSAVNYVATANNIKNIDYGILNRFRIFNIEPPKDNDIHAIVNSIYTNFIKEDIFDLVRIEKDGLRAISNSCISHNISNIRAISKMIEDILMEASASIHDNKLFVIDYISDSYLNDNETLH